MAKKEIAKPIEPRKPSLPEVMKKYGGVFSIDLASGFAHIKFNEEGKMYVLWLNDEGYTEEEGSEVPLEDIERVADFMREMKELRLADYKKPATNR